MSPTNKLSVLISILLAATAISTPAHSDNSTTTSGFKCSGSTTKCTALVGYYLRNTTTLSAVQSLFDVSSFESLLSVNPQLDPSTTTPNYKVHPNSTVRIPFRCACSDGYGISDNVPVYTVLPNNTLYIIATEEYGGLVTYQQIGALNGPTNLNQIEIGQKIRIPLPCSCDDVNGKKVVHYGLVVLAGSTISGIAKEFGTSEETLLKLNGISDPKTLKAGQVLDIPLPVKAHHGNKKLLIILLLCAMLILSVLLSVAYWFLREKKREWKEEQERSMWLTDPNEDENNNSSDVPIYILSDIVAATQNFSSNNKLGEGGFGEVYKGVLSNGQEIAVKRLAKHSGQGMQEFKNEVRLVAKLQHRNLVKTLGCCIQGEEKMLIYEYLPNKSLDKYIFNEEKRMTLNWSKRYDIILGIARGVLYLHQDSRLRIIHRDLKASNVLLDGAMNPKISDFGMARMFGSDQDEANTNRVVGTYGYMSPEYAMSGLISVKSDVFSFGVLSLEIICGKKNRGFHDQQPSNLIGQVWKLWKDGNTISIVDPCIIRSQRNSDSIYDGDNEHKDEILRCIHIGLLCAQDNANERPNMLEVEFMLRNDHAELPSPKQPAYVVEECASQQYGITSTSSGTRGSVNEMTMTKIEAR